MQNLTEDRGRKWLSLCLSSDATALGLPDDVTVQNSLIEIDGFLGSGGSATVYEATFRGM